MTNARKTALLSIYLLKRNAREKKFKIGFRFENESGWVNKSKTKKKESNLMELVYFIAYG